MLDTELWVGKQKNKKNQKRKQKLKQRGGGGGGRKKCARFCLQPLLYKFPTTKKKNEKKKHINKQYSKLKQEKLRGITKCSPTRFI